METAAAHLRVSAHPRFLNNDNEITLSSQSLCFCEWAGCVSIMMSVEMMMNWVRQKHPQLPRTMMVTRHDSYAVISISPGKLLSTFVSFIKWSCLSSEKQRIFIGLVKNVKDENIESNTQWQSIWKNMNLPSFLHLMSYFNLIMAQHWGPLSNTQKDFLEEYTATIVPWLYWSPGHFASSPPPTLCCSGLLLFALIVNCISIVSWYPQLSPSSCQLGAADRNHL